ncbi:MAG: hypothetical protein J6S82_03675 [Bacteroidales bacterium]|nr:hypothetical protein [Bacteroidales bacterium]
MTVNDGNGLYDNEGLCDSLIVDLNNLPKALMFGQNIQFCALIASMGQKLANLKKGIKSDLESERNKVKELQQINDRLMEQVSGIPVERQGESDGK